MKMMAAMTQSWLSNVAPRFFAAMTRFLYGADNVLIGDGLLCDGVPRFLVDDTARLVIGSNVQIRSGVEIRVHGSAKVAIEDGVRIDRGVRILGANDAEIVIGSGARIGLYSVLNGGDSISLGRKCLISGFVYLQASMHRFSDSNAAISDQGYDHSPITLGDGCWLGTHVVVMPGRSIGKGAIVGSNAVVTRDVEDGLVVAGVPARSVGNQSAERVQC